MVVCVTSDLYIYKLGHACGIEHIRPFSDNSTVSRFTYHSGKEREGEWGVSEHKVNERKKYGGRWREQGAVVS